MHNIEFIRKYPAEFDKAMTKRGLQPASSEILAQDKKNRGSKTSLQLLQQQANELAKKIGEFIAKKQDAKELILESKLIKEQILALKNAESQSDADNSAEPVAEELNELLYTLPNILASEVTVGEGEEDNVELRRIGDPRKFSFTPKEHDIIGAKLGLMDFESAVKMSGSRFVVLKGALATLERALAQFMLDIHITEFGYSETLVPLLVKDAAMFGSGQLPKFSEDSFQTTNGYRLIPTSEVSLVNLVADTIIDENKLPLRFTSYSPCFRSEAGSAGKDTRGMIRNHQFSKVELVSIVTKDEAKNEHERMTTCAEEILKRLALPYRVMQLCSKDTGFCAEKTYDLEVWLPGQNKYREISSCSNCGDFQGRRLKARYKDAKGNNHFVYTLNGSALAVGRTLVAIVENYQNEDGSVTVPEALVSYMRGLKKITAVA